MSDIDTAYNQALDYIYSFVDYSLKHSSELAKADFKLDRMFALLSALGNPTNQTISRINLRQRHMTTMDSYNPYDYIQPLHSQDNLSVVDDNRHIVGSHIVLTPERKKRERRYKLKSKRVASLKLGYQSHGKESTQLLNL